MEFSVQWRTLFFGIATLPLLITSSTAWAQDDDWLDGEDDEETTREEGELDDDVDLEDDPDEESIDGRVTEPI